MSRTACISLQLTVLCSDH